ncbi:MAG: S-adenosylmethionine:tRNA ribosyltransferase-isomerase [Pseudomonadota bacterium]
MQLADFDFELPDELIAQTPPLQRRDARLLHVGQGLHHETFADITDRLHPGDLLVLNNTEVIKARFHGNKESGGKVEVLIERILDEHLALCQVKASKALKDKIFISIDAARIQVVERRAPFYVLRFPKQSSCITP